MPFLEVLASPDSSVRLGQRFELTRPSLSFDLGSDPALAFRLPVAAVAQRHARVERSGGSWSLRALHFVPETWLDGVRLRSHQPRLLVHGSVMQLAGGGVVLGYSEREELWPRDAALESALGEAPEDEARWLVWSDFLQERGDAWGAHLTRGGGDEAVRARAFGVLARPWLVDDLSARFSRFGAVTHLQLRPSLSLHPDAGEAEWVLRLLGASKLALFCQTLDLGLFVGAPEKPARHLERAVRLLEALAESPPLPALRRVTLGHAPLAMEVPGLDEAFAKVRRRHPRARLPESPVAATGTLTLRLVQRPKRVYVEGLDVGGTLSLERTTRHSFGGKTGLSVRFKGTFGVKPPAGVVVLSGRNGPWMLSRSTGADKAGVRLNGHDVELEAVVMPGDEVEFGVGLKFQVEEPSAAP